MLDRTTIKIGPCVIIYAGATIYTKDDVRVITTKALTPINTSAFGKVGDHLSDVKTEIQFTPAGELEAAALTALWPHTNPVMGASLFGSDTPIVIHPLNGLEKMSYPAAAVTKMPDIILDPDATPIGPCTITCIGKNNTAWTDAAKRFTLTASEAAPSSSLTTSNIRTSVYAAALAGASSPWDDIQFEKRAVISFNMTLKEYVVHSEGLADIFMQNLAISTRFAPTGISVAEMTTKLKVQGAGVYRGMAIEGDAEDITFTGAQTGDFLVTVNDVVPTEAPQVYGFEQGRHGDVNFIATRPTGEGAMFSVALVS